MIPKGTMPKVSIQTFRNLVKTHLEEVDSPRSLSIWIIMNHTDRNGGTDDEILSLRTDPKDYLTSSEFFKAYSPTELVRKFSGLTLSSDPRDIAKAKFLETEEQCRQSNRRIRTSIPTGRLGQILDLARKIIENTLPEVTKELLDRLGDMGGWGAGVTSSNKGPWQSDYNKLLAIPEATPAFARIANQFLAESPQLSALHPNGCRVIPGNTVGFVPKDARSHRAIAVEPSFNMFFQTALGKVLRQALLRRLGLDLRSQERNQILARYGSVRNDLATVDLSSASDTISIAAVELLLPTKWVSLLGLVRSEHYELDGEIRRYHKWSSMGNGYTFELETLIFSSIVKAIIHKASPEKQLWSVYGDDIIIHRSFAEDLGTVLAYLGFSINWKKTFFDSPFRESCGKDYFLGDLVRPFYLKEVKGLSVYTWANWLRQSAPAYYPIRKTWNALYRSVAKRFRYWAPPGDHGLVAFFMNDYEVDPTFASLIRRPYGPLIGYSCVGLRWEPKRLPSISVDGGAAVAASLRLLAVRSPTALSDPLIVSGKELGRWVRRRSIIPDWPLLRVV